MEKVTLLHADKSYIYCIDQGIIDVGIITGALSIGWMALTQEYFDIYQRYFYLHYH